VGYFKLGAEIVQELKELEGKFKATSSGGQGVLSLYLDEVIPNVHRTIISKGAIYNVRPFEIERAGFKKGRQLKKMPASIKNTHIYYLDESGRILLVEIYGQSENIINKEFYSYGENYVERSYFASAGKLRNVSRLMLENGLIKKDLNWGEYGCSISDYQYSGGKLERVIVRQKEHADNSFGEFEVNFEYSGEELIKIVNVFPNGYREQRFP